MRALFYSFSIALIGISLSGCRISANFHEVEKNQFYRSAQLEPKEFEKAFKAGIKLVINLRGAQPGDSWYDQEIAMAEKYGVEVVSIGMSAQRLPHKADLHKLIHTFDRIKREKIPTLVHCRAGADRTGLASAIWVHTYMEKGRKAALKMLTPKYLHIAAGYPSKRYFMKYFYQGRDWALDLYDPCEKDVNYLYYNKAECSSAKKAALTEEDDS